MILPPLVFPAQTLAHFTRGSENLTTFSTGRIRTRPRRPRKHCRRRAPRDERWRRIRRRRRRVVSPSAAHLRRRPVEGDHRPLAARPGSRKVCRRKYWRQREDPDQDCPVLLDCSGYWLYCVEGIEIRQLSCKVRRLLFLKCQNNQKGTLALYLY